MDEFCRYVHSDIVALLAEIIASTTDTQYGKEISDQGQKILDVLLEVEKEIGRVDVRNCGDSGDLCQQMIDFHQLLSRLAVQTKITELYYKRVEKFKELLNLNWNTMLEPMEQMKIHVGLYSFHKISPLVKVAAKIKCTHEDCSDKNVELANKKTLVLHFKNVHKGCPVPDLPDNYQEPVATCLLSDTKSDDQSQKCMKKYPTNQLYRHLDGQHNVKRPGKLFFIRGFESYDGEKTFRAVFLRNSDPDPIGPKVETVASGSGVQNPKPTQRKRKLEFDNSDDEHDNDSSRDDKPLPKLDDELEKLEKAGNNNSPPYEEDILEKETEEMNEEYDRTMYPKNASEVVSAAAAVPVVEEANKASGTVLVQTVVGDQVVSQSNVSIAFDPKMVISSNEELVGFTQSTSEGPLLSVTDEIMNEPTNNAPPEVVHHASKDAKTSKINLEKAKQSSKPEAEKEKVEAKSRGVRKSLEVTFVGDDSFTESEISDTKEMSMTDKEHGPGDVPEQPDFTKILDVEVDEEVDYSSDEEFEEIQDSDLEDGDNEDFRILKQRNKVARWEKRSMLTEAKDICKVQENEQVINEFRRNLGTKHFSTTNSKKSTVSYQEGHLFKYVDSLLQFETSRDPNYNLMMNVDPSSSHFQVISDPNKWIHSIGGSNGREQYNRRINMYKSWVSWFDYVQYTLQECLVGDKYLNKQKEINLVLSNMSTMKRRIEKINILGQLKTIQKQEKRRKQNAEDLLNPSKNIDEIKAVPVWFSSAAHQEELEKFEKIHKEAMKKDEEREEGEGPKKVKNKGKGRGKGKSKKTVDDGAGAAAQDVIVKKRDFVYMANICRFYLVLTGKIRNSCYNFTNLDFASRVELYFENKNATAIVEIPVGVDCTVPPESDPKMESNACMIKLCGDHESNKEGEQQVLYMNKFSEELLLKFRDVKEARRRWGEIDPKESDPFLVNYEGLKLSPIANTPGSIWRKFQNTCNLDRSSVNVIRRGLEAHVQNSPSALSRIQDITSHTQAVGDEYYHRTSPLVKSSVMHQMSMKEGSNLQKPVELSDDVMKKRAKLDLKDKEMSLNEAKKTLQKEVTQRQISKYTKLIPQDRVKLQEEITNPENGEIFDKTKAKFPAEKAFKKVFYRFIDGNATEDIRAIEERIFSSVKADIEKEMGESWSNKKEMNQLADVKCATLIRNSFKAHEKNLKKNEKSYFKF